LLSCRFEGFDKWWSLWILSLYVLGTMLITYFALRPLKSTLKFVPEGVVESIERFGVSDVSNDNGQASSPLHGEGNGLTAPLLAGDDEQVSSMVDVPGGDTHKLMWMGQQTG
jgi:hypothetical protein